MNMNFLEKSLKKLNINSNILRNKYKSKCKNKNIKIKKIVSKDYIKSFVDLSCKQKLIYNTLINKYNIKDYDNINDMTQEDKNNEFFIIQKNYSAILNKSIDNLDSFIEYNYVKNLQYMRIINFNIHCEICVNHVKNIQKKIISNINILNNNNITTNQKILKIFELNKYIINRKKYSCFCDKKISNTEITNDNESTDNSVSIDNIDNIIDEINDMDII